MSEADNFERAMQDIAIEAAGNGGPTPAHMLTALTALAKDIDVQHDESLGAVESVRVIVAEHIAESSVRDDRLDELEAWRRKNATECSDHVLAVVKPLLEERDDAHAGLHAEHMTACHAHAPRRESDPEDVTFEDKRDEEPAELTEMRVVYRFSKRAIALIAIPLALLLLGVVLNFALTRYTASNEVRVDKTDFTHLIQILEQEHGTPLPTATP